MSDAVRLTIEGREVEVPKGTNLLEAAKLAGVLVPHYCYHPSLPVAGVCRMCLVEVEGWPKLAAACATPVVAGMVARVSSPKARQGRQGVLEFLLINHPLDCPICDQAGECELQDYVFREGRSGTRYTEYAKRYAPVEEFGPDVLYVPNRCILCTRCVRFMDHVAGEAVLNVSERGDRAHIGIAGGQALDHPWAGNVVDLCPVGSLLSKDFLHKARAWDLDKTASVCTGCTQGCSVVLETRDNTVLRIRPRYNPEVNRHFICDHGRLAYHWMNRRDRLEAPLVREGGRLVPVGWEQAIARTADALRSAKAPWIGLVSAGSSCEALEAAAALLQAGKGTGAFRVARGAAVPLHGVPGLALREERAPNVRGAEAAGFGRDWPGAVAAMASAGLLLVLDEALDGVGAPPADVPFVYVGTVLPDAARGATVVLPCANVAEEEGTFVNVNGLRQPYCQATTAPGMARPAAWILDAVRGAVGAGAEATA
jgi:NADH-quinone oxidoreductase subunit G